MILLAVKFGLLLCSFLGYILILYKKGLEIAFAPILACVGIGLSMFAAGLLNLMPYMVPVLFCGGLVCLGYMAYGFFKKQYTLSKHEGVVLGFFFVFLAFMTLRLRSALILEIDNFTHWLTVVKDMLRSDKMPSFTSFMVGFKSYPTGTAGFIYYVAKIVGQSDGTYLVGQAILYISALTCFWAFTRQNHLLSALFILPASVFLLANDNPVNSLCVDTMLSMVGIAGFSILVYHRNHLHLAAILTCLLSSFAILVKNSGIFFVAVHFCLLLVLTLRSAEYPDPVSRRKALTKAIILGLLIPLMTFFLWNRHVDYVFTDGNSASHSMSVERFSSVLAGKTAEEASAIVSAFGNWLLRIDASKTIVLLLLAIYLVHSLIQKAFRQGHSSVDFGFFAYGLFSAAVYISGLLGMYFVSMGGVEALNLAAIERYFKTFVMYLLGTGVVYVILDLENKDSVSYLRRLTACGLIAFSLSSAWAKIPFVFHDTIDYTQTVRYRFQNILETYGIPEGSGCYILYTEEACGEAFGYMQFVSRYELWTWGNLYVENTPPQMISDYDNIINNYDYLIVMYEDETVDQFVGALGLTPGESAYYLGSLRQK